MGNKAKTKKRVNGESANAKPRPTGVHLKGSGAKYRALFDTVWDGEVNARMITYEDELVILAAIRDITERKRPEVALQESEERYRILTETASAGIGIADENENLIFVNPAFAQMLGCSLDGLFGMNLSKLTDHKEFKRYQEQTHTRVKGDSSRYESRLICRDGSIKDADISASALTAADGSYEGTVAVVTNITERRKTEEALRQNKAMMEQAQSLVHVGSWMWNVKDNSFLMSAELCRIYGIPEGQQPGSIQAMIDKFIHPDDREYVQKASQAMTKNHAGERLVYRIIRPDEEVRWISSTQPDVSRVDEEGKPEVMLGAIRDITEWKKADEEEEKMEAQLRQWQKMEAVGRLAGGMAHDFNNLLTAIRGYPDLALVKLPEDHQAYQDVDHVREASIRAASLADQLLLFSRPHRVASRPVNLNKAIWDVSGCSSESSTRSTLSSPVLSRTSVL
ncbi:PAS domain S-box protein [candidate division TA06 bacterium]|uniref:histidine kinase n=1 Tax=candidate division TA06 bacterium TaxID=2250710 RepID=A0A523USP1_UNCT6|nr:MAG: PAS domain S-box protein [candidate division TA06 bacterium]